MGEVWRATDTKLHRDVAIKMLPSGFAADTARMQRFEREARVLASLNHPNIAAIHSIEQGALVMELVEGECLKGPLPVSTAIAYARQIVAGLEAAHEKGIVHRDLKPANIKVTADGVLKLLDFGLAKAAEEPPAHEQSPNLSPTLSLEMTRTGMILGTAAYMSPEQARGKPVDKRADIWAFGVVLYEMLTGRRPFDSGETMTDVIAAIITREPDWSALPPETPRHIQRLIERCLRKDAKNRLRDIGDARIALEEGEDLSPRGVIAQTPRPRARLLPWALALASMAAAGWMMWRGSTTSPTELMHFDLSYPPNVEAVVSTFALSPDGRGVAFTGVRDGLRRLYVRHHNRPDAVEIADSLGSNVSEFSEDGDSIVFMAGGSMTRLRLSDRQRSIVLKGAGTGAGSASGLAWAREMVTFQKDGELWTISERGGQPQRLTTLDASRHEVLHGDPLVLPGTRTVLFTSQTTQAGGERIEAVSLDGGKRSIVMEQAVRAVWSPTGHLLFGRDGAVWAAPFDAGGATVRGPAVRVLPAGVVSTLRSGAMAFRVSSNGSLVFAPADLGFNRVVSVARDGSELTFDLPPNRYGNPRVSTDGRRLVVESRENLIETLDLENGRRASLGTAAMGTSFPTWTTDDNRVVFRRFNLPFWSAAEPSGQSGTVPHGTINDYPSSPGPDPDSFLALRIEGESSGDIILMSVSGKFPPKTLIATPAYEGGAQLSPNRQWMVYQSNESGQSEIYVRRYPALDRTWQLSEGGGVQPRWSSSGSEIFYRIGSRMMAVTIGVRGTEPVFGKPQILFTGDYDYGVGNTTPNYDVSRDGRFVMLRRTSRGSGLHVVLHWTEELKRIVAADGIH
jgi:serine/threonine protein kinase